MNLHAETVLAGLHCLTRMIHGSVSSESVKQQSEPKPMPYDGICNSLRQLKGAPSGASDKHLH